ncbi:MAG: hypothetical protein JST39_06270 [Bacteroidetes bacterium]|nr:hypothetical protein [Bacteroidota bacterium]
MRMTVSLAAAGAATLILFATCQKSLHDSTITPPGTGATTPVDTTPVVKKDTTLTVAYVEVNSNNFNNTGCFLYDNNKQFFNIACIFAANINYSPSTGKPVLYYNTQVTALLNNTSYVKDLQSLGIKVMLTVLGNHQNAGWSCFTDTVTTNDFAAQLSAAIAQYGFDGIDIDDEYSACTGNDSSMIMAAYAIKKRMPGKLLTKALYKDINQFKTSWHGLKLAGILDYGWEMSYGGNPDLRIQPYLAAGMPASKLGIGAASGDADGASIATYVKTNKLKVMMVYNLNKNSQSWLSTVSNVLFGTAATVKSGCLQ